MESWPPDFIRPDELHRDHQSPSLAAVCTQIRRLEEVADRKLKEPPMRAKIDTALLPQFHADRLAGMTLQQLAQKYSVSPSTASYWCHKLNGQAPTSQCSESGHAETAPQPNGQPPATTTLKATSEVDQLLLEHWSRLPLLTRLKLLLDRA
jgi:hypothetical protein